MSTNHLSKSQIEELMSRYYAGDNPEGLIEEFILNISPGRLYTLFPPIVREDLEACPYCGIYPIQKRASKSAIKTGYRIPEPYCSECGHKYLTSCRCENCMAEKERLALLEEKALRSKINSLVYGPRNNAITIEQLSLKEAIDLLRRTY